MNENAERDTARDQAAAQLASIVEMMAAVECDFDRLQELREVDTDELSADDAEELSELSAAAGDCEDEDDARRRIDEDPLSVEVRTDWHAPGEDSEPAEFCILLCTGGPAVRIVGDLDRGQPSRPRLEYQDWGTPWTEYFPDRAGRDALQSYCECFYFGE